MRLRMFLALVLLVVLPCFAASADTLRMEDTVYILQQTSEAQPNLTISVQGEGFDPQTFAAVSMGVLVGVEIGVYARDAQGEYVPFPDPSDPSRPLVLVTGQTPVSVALPLSVDLYLRQDTAHEGYLPDPEYIALDLPQTVTLTNRQEGMQGLWLTLVADGAPPEGISFSLEGPGGARTFATDAQGNAVLAGLAPGTYTLRQLTAPDGYSIDQPAQEIAIVANEPLRLQVHNSRNGSIQLRALGLVLDADKVPRLVPIARPYEVLDAQGVLCGTLASGERLDLPASAEGTRYTLRAAAGWQDDFAADGQTYEIELTPGASVTVQAVVRSNGGFFAMSHVDAETGEAVAGGVFTLYDGQGQAVLTFETDGEGRYASGAPLSPGTYTLRMNHAAEGYIYTPVQQPVEIAPYFSDGNPVAQAVVASQAVPQALLAPVVTTQTQALPSLFDADAIVDFTLRVFEKEPALPVSSLSFQCTLSDPLGMRVLENRADGGRLFIAGRYPVDGMDEVTALTAEGAVSYTFSYPVDDAGTQRQVDISAPFAVTVATFAPSAISEYAIGGHVYDEWGQPMAQVTVTQDSGGAQTSIQTDVFGAYAFAAHPEGATIQVGHAAGYGVRMDGVDAYVLPLETITGRVIAYGGLQGYPVSFSLGDAVDVQPRADGTFTLETTLLANDVFYLDTPEDVLWTVEETEEGVLVHLYPAATLAGRAADPDGVPVAGMRVVMTAQDTGETLSATTDADGRFSFTGLMAGGYSLDYEPPAGYVLNGARRETLALAVGEQKANLAIDAMIPASITGQLLDDGTPCEGIGVTLYPAGHTVQTDAEGSFAFDVLSTGSYTLAFDLPENMLMLDTPGEIILTRSAETWNQSMRIIRHASLSGRVWDDANDDGYMTGDEGGVPGITVALLDEGGETVATQTTGSDGSFAFAQIVPGIYRLGVTLPDGLIFARTAPGTERIAAGVDTPYAESRAYTLASGEVLGNLSCGAVTAGSIAGIVWQDLDGDGLRTEQEPPLSGAQVTLVRGDGETETVQTDATGAYRFASLRPADYILRVTLPDGFILTRQTTSHADRVTGSDLPMRDDPTSEMAVSLRRWRMDVTVSAGAQRAGVLQARVWYDKEATGEDPGDAGLEGVQVTLRSEAGDRLAQAETDAQGQVRFAALRPGHYQLEYALPDNGDWGFTAGATQQGSGAVQTVGDGQTVQAPAVGMTRYGSIAGIVFDDADYDGLRGDAEGGVSADVSLLDAHGNLLRTTHTDRNGAYAFDGLKTALYSIRFEVIDAYAFTRNRMDAPSYNSDVPETAQSSAQTDLIFLPLGEALLIDAGVYRHASVSGALWHDAQANGVRTADSAPLADMEIVLLRDGEVVAQTRTTAAGQYAFDHLAPATYALRVSLPETMRFSPSGRLLSAQGTVGETTPFTLSDGERLRELDLGAVYTGGVSGKVTDGRQGVGIADVAVYLARDGVSLGPIATGADGTYRFDALLPGEAELRFALPEGWIFDTQAVDAQSVVVSQRETAMAADTVCLPEAIVEGVFWLDADADAHFSEAEAPVLGVEAALYRLEEGEEPTLVATQKTGVDGRYSIGQLLPGLYSLRLTPPAGMVFYDGNELGPITLEAGGREDLSAAAYIGSVIAGVVWEDLNNDGLRAADEPLLEGVAVALVLVDGTRFAATETDAAGAYRFVEVPPGICAVRFELPDAYIFTTPAEGGSVVPQIDASAGLTEALTIQMGERRENIHAGALRHTRVGDLVWLDANGNGLQDTDEVGITGLSVRLLRVLLDGSEQEIERTLTDANGRYRFDSVRPGTYRVAFEIGDYLPTQPFEGLDQINSKLPWKTGELLVTAPFVAQSGRHTLTIDAGLVTIEIADRLGWVIEEDGSIREK